MRDTRPNTGRRSLRRHLAGWQLGVLTLGIALLAALVGMPRPVAPGLLPAPNIDRRALARELTRQEARADQAERQQLPFEVRAVGEAFHRYGAANYAEDAPGMERELAELRRRARAALARYGKEPLLRLRAVQTRLFLHSLLRWEGTDRVPAELKQLGGNFVSKAMISGWVAPGRRLRMDPSERRILFCVRWAELTGLLSHDAFAPTLNDWRVYYGFLLRHPESPAASVARSARDPSSGRAELAEQLAYVKALLRRDPNYPGALARGVLAYRLERFDESAQEFRGYLRDHANGRWRLRAQNYFLAALLAARAQRAGVLNSPIP